MSLTKPALALLSLLMLGCTTSSPPQYGYVDWFLSNGTGTSLSLVVYDKICKRTFFRIQVARTGETSITTCSDSEGRADIRYKYGGGLNSSYNPWFDNRINRNQVLIVR